MYYLLIKTISKGIQNRYHCGLDAKSPEKYTLIVRGLRVKPAMTAIFEHLQDSAK